MKFVIGEKFYGTNGTATYKRGKDQAQASRISSN
jgi:hypothetical protein